MGRHSDHLIPNIRMTVRVLCLLFLISSCWRSALHAEELLVFAAASLTEALQESAKAFESETGIHVVFNLGGSGLLARQIEQGGPADLFFSADEARMDGLERGGWLLDGTRRTRLANTLVVVVPRDSRLQVSSAASLTNAVVRRLALADAQTVPAGMYAKSYLESLQIWNALKARVLPAESVRAALAAVESGNADAGIVYKTDAAMSTKVRVALEITATEGPKIRYPLAVIRTTRHPEAARRLLDHLSGAWTGEIFLRHGFQLLPPSSQ